MSEKLLQLFRGTNAFSCVCVCGGGCGGGGVGVGGGGETPLPCIINRTVGSLSGGC